MKKPIYKRWYVWFLVLAIIGGIMSVFEKDEPEEITKEELVIKEVSLEEEVEKIIQKEVKDEDIENLSIVQLDNGKSVRAVMKHTPLSNKTYKRELLLKSQDILKGLYEHDEISFINLEWHGKFVDEYGNEKYSPVMRIDIKKETLDEINWDNFDIENIENIADDYWQHEQLN